MPPYQGQETGGTTTCLIDDRGQERDSTTLRRHDDRASRQTTAGHNRLTSVRVPLVSGCGYNARCTYGLPCHAKIKKNLPTAIPRISAMSRFRLATSVATLPASSRRWRTSTT